MIEYAQNLYKKEYITGHTGSIDDNPTVYFENGPHLGRINQEHPDPNQIGRQVGMSNSEIKRTIGDDGILIESVDGEVFHHSRTPYTEATTDEQIEKLAGAIDKFKEIKPAQKKIEMAAKVMSYRVNFEHSDRAMRDIIKFVRESKKAKQEPVFGTKKSLAIRNKKMSPKR